MGQLHDSSKIRNLCFPLDRIDTLIEETLQDLRQLGGFRIHSVDGDNIRSIGLLRCPAARPRWIIDCIHRDPYSSRVACSLAQHIRNPGRSIVAASKRVRWVREEHGGEVIMTKGPVQAESRSLTPQRIVVDIEGLL